MSKQIWKKIYKGMRMKNKISDEEAERILMTMGIREQKSVICLLEIYQEMAQKKDVLLANKIDMDIEAIRNS